MAEFGDSLEELQVKLSQYREQLAAVGQALLAQPDEPALEKLRSDLHEVISLTEDLVQFHRATAAGTIPPQLTAAVVQQQELQEQQQQEQQTQAAGTTATARSSKADKGKGGGGAAADGRIRNSAQAAATAITIKKKVKEIVTPGGYRIPEFLTIKETDTATQRHQKKRKVQAIKKEQRQEVQETEANARATSWRKFSSKASSKKVKGFLTGRKHESIFKSSDDVAPISTTTNILSAGSGFIPRRRHDFAGLDSEDLR
eukprot:GHVS01001231.1.p1 GENE.GHVS01001231.1~~GHVS01001231.1.p1  ORF type:complete len:258 (+),score=60.00 GHVS01001231.1:167-940(+)